MAGTNNDGACLQLSKFLLHMCNALVIMVFGAIVTLIAVTYNSDPFFDSDNAFDKMWLIVQTCSICGQTAALALAVYSFVTLTSIFGFLAICSRERCLLTTYASMALTMVMFMSAITTGIILTDQGQLDNSLYQLWDGVEQAGICNMETIFECSGWYNVCVLNETYNIYNDSAPNSSIDVIGTGLIVPDGCADCGAFQNELNANFTTTCDDQFYNYLDMYVYEPLVSTTSALLVMAAIAVVVAFKIRAKTVLSATQGEVLGLLNTEYKEGSFKEVPDMRVYGT
eukprot:GDKJ01015442.1.p1 GENE.GDKJ01015442.1~~GDKJ01015442.1.p1  ORF type:complete len:283 (-),score=31.40 GDKJ01015442.1:303-1151(-)